MRTRRNKKKKPINKCNEREREDEKKNNRMELKQNEKKLSINSM